MTNKHLYRLNNFGPFLYGVGSLGNVSGGYSRIRFYFRGSYIQDMRKDWMRVGDAFRESFLSYKH